MEPDIGPQSAIGAEEIERRVVAVLDGLGVPYEIHRTDPAFADFDEYARFVATSGNLAREGSMGSKRRSRSAHRVHLTVCPEESTNMPTFRRFALAIVTALTLLGSVPAFADGPFVFFTLTPCRVVDTRTGFGGALTHNTTRDFAVQGVCGVPAGAKAAMLNVTAVSPPGQGHLRVFPSGVTLPVISTVNFSGNDFAVANGAIVPLSTNANDLSVFTFLLAGSGSVHLVLDVTGYFAPISP